MPTVTQILDRAAKYTGLRLTGTERALALQALQDAYARSVVDSEIRLVKAEHTFTQGLPEYAIADLVGSQPMKLYHVSMNDKQIHQTSFQELLDYRNVGSDFGGHYATIGFTGIGFHPNPNVGDKVTVWFTDPVPTLVEGGPTAGQQDTPSWIPEHFQWSVLLPATVLEMMDKDQRENESAMWNARYDRAMARLKEWVGQFGGEANRFYLRK